MLPVGSAFSRVSIFHSPRRQRAKILEYSARGNSACGPGSLKSNDGRKDSSATSWPGLVSSRQGRGGRRLRRVQSRSFEKNVEEGNRHARRRIAGTGELVSSVPRSSVLSILPAVSLSGRSEKKERDREREKGATRQSEDPRLWVFAYSLQWPRVFKITLGQIGFTAFVKACLSLN